MVEKILLLDKLNRVELIKLLNVDNLDLEKLLDLKIVVEKELKDKYKTINKIEFKNEYNNYYNEKLSGIYNELDGFSIVDLIELIKIQKMDFCELLYLDIIVDNAINNVLSMDDNSYFDKANNLFSLYDYGTCNFGKINFTSIGRLIYGFDGNYNFYVGKIDKDKRCILFNIMRKGLPYELVRDILIFDGVVSDGNKLTGFWNVGSSEINAGIKKINNMGNVNYSSLCDTNFELKNLSLAYVACNEKTGSLDVLLKRINDTGKKLIRM